MLGQKPWAKSHGTHRLYSDRSPFGLYDHHIRLDNVPSNKIHIILDIHNFLDFFY